MFGALNDQLFAPQAIEDTARLHGGVAEIIPDLAHAMMLDANWEHAAERVLFWLDEVQA